MGSAFLWGSKIALNHLGVVVVIVAERALQAAKAPGFSTSLFRLDRELSKATIIGGSCLTNVTLRLDRELSDVYQRPRLRLDRELSKATIGALERPRAVELRLDRELSKATILSRPSRPR